MFLLEEGKVNPNINDSDGVPILLRMAEHGNPNLIGLYFAKGGNLHVINETNNRNAIHYCVISKVDLNTIRYLISLGVDFKAKDGQGMSPLDLAEPGPTEKFLRDAEKE